MVQSEDSNTTIGGEIACMHCDDHRMGLFATAMTGRMIFWCDRCGSIAEFDRHTGERWDETPKLIVRLKNLTGTD